jgi:4-diphosphocytidyl-2-C-methyl-D-erythritol kinase
MEALTINSPAKINFGLNVVSKRSDGYHNIETIFYPLNLYDQLIIKKSDSIRFQSNIETLSSGEDNLIIKAVNLLEEYVNQKFYVNIILNKKIPIGGGLGGGSSNAASILNGLIKLINLNISEKELIHIALQIGSDVPFFLDPKPKFAEGKGEVLKEIDFKINLPVLVINPGIYVSTPWAYSKILSKKPEINLDSIIEKRFKNFSELKGIVTNDFEKIVFEEFPEIGILKNDLYRHGAEFALMTGSGSTLFGIFPDIIIAKDAEKIFSEKYFTFIHQEV